MKSYLWGLVAAGGVYYIAEYQSTSTAIAIVALMWGMQSFSIEERLKGLSDDMIKVFDEVFSRNSNL